MYIICVYKRSSLWHTGPACTCACAQCSLRPSQPGDQAVLKGFLSSLPPSLLSAPIPFTCRFTCTWGAGWVHQVLKSLALAAGPSGQLETPECPWPLSEGERAFRSPPWSTHHGGRERDLRQEKRQRPASSSRSKDMCAYLISQELIVNFQEFCKPVVKRSHHSTWNCVNLSLN